MLKKTISIVVEESWRAKSMLYTVALALCLALGGCVSNPGGDNEEGNPTLNETRDELDGIKDRMKEDAEQ